MSVRLGMQGYKFSTTIAVSCFAAEARVIRLTIALFKADHEIAALDLTSRSNENLGYFSGPLGIERRFHLHGFEIE